MARFEVHNVKRASVMVADFPSSKGLRGFRTIEIVVEDDGGGDVIVLFTQDMALTLTGESLLALSEPPQG